jgi:hypothetical protein
MAFLETLHANLGCLLRLKSELYWYGGRGWDGNSDRICLILNVSGATVAAGRIAEAVAVARFDPLDIVSWSPSPNQTAVVLLIIDGSPKWVCVNEKTCELLASELV